MGQAQGERLERETTVLFAVILGGADLIAKAGDAAAVASLAGCLAHLKKAAEHCGARVLDLAAEKLMILLPTPDAAADAAAAMHSAMDTLPQAAETKLALGVGFHHGPVIQKDDGVFGDTVNLAAQLVAQAASGQIITTRETASHLSPLYRAWMRKLYSIDIKGRSGQVALCELVWRADDNATLFAKNRNTPPAAPTPTPVWRRPGRHHADRGVPPHHHPAAPRPRLRHHRTRRKLRHHHRRRPGLAPALHDRAPAGQVVPDRPQHQRHLCQRGRLGRSAGAARGVHLDRPRPHCLRTAVGVDDRNRQLHRRIRKLVSVARFELATPTTPR